jgi:hypothetical protein
MLDLAARGDSSSRMISELLGSESRTRSPFVIKVPALTMRSGEEPESEWCVGSL